MSTALSITSLSKTYSNGVQALKNINLDIESGDFFALLGSNGAGKTTIIGITTGLVNKSGGKVKVFGTDIDIDFNHAKSLIGIVPQEFNFNVWGKVIDIVTDQAGYYGIPRSVSVPRANQILDELGLGSKKNFAANTLSGGMKRRLMIARALIHRPQFLILDEPTAGVDVELRVGMWDYLKRINAEGVTILLTTHYLEEVEQLCHNAAIIKQGEIIKKDSVKNLIGSLEKETYTCEVENSKDWEQIIGFEVKKVDDQSLEASLTKDQTLNDLIFKLTQHGIKLKGIRPKGNRLEELFINIVNS